MAGLTPYTDILKNLSYQVKKLTSTGITLNELCDKEACRLKRQGEASRLRALCLSIRQELEWAEMREDAAKSGHTKANLIVSLTGLAVGSIIKMASKSKQLAAFSDYLITGLTNEQRHFGTVLVAIGPKGLPDDVEVVSISQLARDSNREEYQVINQLRERGYILLSEKTFSLLIDKLIIDIKEERLCLPISTEKLAEIKPSTSLRMVVKKLG